MPKKSFRPRLPHSPPGGHAAMARIFRIHSRLAQQRDVTAKSLADELEVSSRTIKRDIECMRDRCQAPIAWDPVNCTYRYTAPCPFLPMLRLEADEALALVLAGETFAAWKGTPLGEALTSAFGKFSEIAGPHISLPATQLSQCLFHPEENTLGNEHRHFAHLIEDIFQHCELTLDYRKPRTSRAERRTVQPIHLARLDHSWMLIAADPTKGEWRNFLLSRIEHLEATGAHFTPPPREKIHAYLRGSLGRFTGPDEIDVRLRFDAIAAPYVRERPWHASQHVLSTAPDGSLEIELRLNNLIDVQRRVLACGQHIEVLAPSTLRETIRTELRAMLARHEG